MSNVKSIKAPMVGMAKSRKTWIDKLAGIEYAGVGGCSAECQDAVVRLLQYGDLITLCRILTHSSDEPRTHCLLLTINSGDLVAVKSGFASGYGGEGPHTFSYVLELLDAHNVEIEEYEVDETLIERLDRSCLLTSDLEHLSKARPIRPSRWADYIEDRHWTWSDEKTLWRDFPLVMPLAVIDPRLIDLAVSFGKDPDERLLTAYRRLEDRVRMRTDIKEHGAKLFSRAFLGDSPKLFWQGLDGAEHAGRAQLFIGAFGAHRNPRAHRELNDRMDEQLSEFLLVNHLYRLEAEAAESERELYGTVTNRKAHEE
jgi:hypothetical protein